MRAIAGIALAVAMLTSGCRKDRSPGEDGGTNAKAASRSVVTPTTSALAETARAGARVPGLAFAAVTRDAETIGATGLADVASRQSATGETIFEAASIAKLVVATCVMQLVEAGRLDLDAEVGTYVGFAVRHPRWRDRITLRMLLTHRSSIRDLDEELTAGAAGNPLGAFLGAYLARDGAPRTVAFLESRPGSTHAYSNVGAAVAALAVEHVSGEDFAIYSAKRVFTPLRMRSTAWARPGPRIHALATPHAYRNGALVALPPPSHAVYPAVDLLASAGDLARFARAILRSGELDGARILSEASVRAMLEGEAAQGVHAEQALGWQLRTIGARHVVGHEGEDAGASTALFLDMAAGTGAVVLANGDAFTSGEPARAQAIQTMIAELLTSSR